MGGILVTSDISVVTKMDQMTLSYHEHNPNMLRTNHFRARRKHPFIKLAYTLQARLPLNFYISELTKKMRMRPVL